MCKNDKNQHEGADNNVVLPRDEIQVDVKNENAELPIDVKSNKERYIQLLQKLQQSYQQNGTADDIEIVAACDAYKRFQQARARTLVASGD